MRNLVTLDIDHPNHPSCVSCLCLYVLEPRLMRYFQNIEVLKIIEDYWRLLNILKYWRLLCYWQKSSIYWTIEHLGIYFSQFLWGRMQPPVGQNASPLEAPFSRGTTICPMGNRKCPFVPRGQWAPRVVNWWGKFLSWSRTGPAEIELGWCQDERRMMCRMMVPPKTFHSAWFGAAGTTS